jgi:hypothetical protein
MKIQIVAAADIGSFVARDEDWAFYVLTLDDVREIDCGDVLSGRSMVLGACFIRCET